MSKKLYVPYGSFCIFAIVFMLLFPDAVKESILISCQRCLFSLLPSFFPIMVFSRQIYQLFCLSGEKTGKIFSGLTKIDKKFFPIFITALFCGYPTPAILCKKGLEDGIFTKKEAEISSVIFDCASPAFLFLLVGKGIYGNIISGICLYLIQIGCMICACRIFLPSTKKEKLPFAPSKESFSESVSKSICNMLEIFGFVIFFSLISDITDKILKKAGISFYLRTFLVGMTEITGGIVKISDFPLFVKTAYLCAFISFCGLSVAFQISSFVKFDIKTFLKIRLFMFVSMFCSFLAVLKIFEFLSLQ